MKRLRNERGLSQQRLAEQAAGKSGVPRSRSRRPSSRCAARWCGRRPSRCACRPCGCCGDCGRPSPGSSPTDRFHDHRCPHSRRCRFRSGGRSPRPTRRTTWCSRPACAEARGPARRAGPQGSGRVACVGPRPSGQRRGGREGCHGEECVSQAIHGSSSRNERREEPRLRTRAPRPAGPMVRCAPRARGSRRSRRPRPRARAPARSSCGPPAAGAAAAA